ncbi:hypothetical protein AB0I84_04690 [Streptomyces spectabilis]|uniref:hypothetical protein n=1 Tax=Streptomyces spectabilis TaxID=68270 RepID=UPI0033C9D5B7
MTAPVPLSLDVARMRADVFVAAARTWRHGLDSMDRMSVASAARACYEPGGPSLIELERRIRADRARRLVGAQISAA